MLGSSDTEWLTGVVADWTVAGGGIYNPSPMDITGEAIEGELVVYLNSGGYIVQDLTYVTLAPVLIQSKQSFTVSFYSGIRTQYSSSGTITVQIADSVSGDVLAQSVIDLATQSVDSWEHREIELAYTSNSIGLGNQVRLVIYTAAPQVIIDVIDVKLANTAQVPEPLNESQHVDPVSQLNWTVANPIEKTFDLYISDSDPELTRDTTLIMVILPPKIGPCLMRGFPVKSS